MLTQEQQDYAARVMRTLQIIVGALITGPLAFLIFTLATHDPGAVNPEKSFLSTLGILFAAACSAAALFVPRIVMAQSRKAIVGGTWQPNQQAAAPPEEGRRRRRSGGSLSNEDDHRLCAARSGDVFQYIRLQCRGTAGKRGSSRRAPVRNRHVLSAARSRVELAGARSEPSETDATI